eukprot:846752_1
MADSSTQMANVEPTQVAKPTLDANPSTQNEIYSDLNQRKWWHREHIIWLFVFGVTVYDYITDVAVVMSWLSIGSVCPEVRCVWKDDVSFQLLSVILLSSASFGFISALVIKIYEATKLYFIYKYLAKNTDQSNNADLNTVKRAIWLGWIPLVTEDLVSLGCVWLAYFSKLQHIDGLQQIYTQSMIASIISIGLALLMSFRKRWKLSNSKSHKEYKCVLCFHWVWCYPSGCFLVVATIIVVFTTTLNDMFTVVDIKDPSKTNACGLNDPFVEEWFEGDVLRSPGFVYSNCSGSDYEYKLRCASGADVYQDKSLHCALNWTYTLNTTQCLNSNGDQCEFQIELNIEEGICGNYTIDCDNNFVFTDGNPVMWACFGYCRA